MMDSQEKPSLAENENNKPMEENVQSTTPEAEVVAEAPQTANAEEAPVVDDATKETVADAPAEEQQTAAEPVSEKETLAEENTTSEAVPEPVEKTEAPEEEPVAKAEEAPAEEKAEAKAAELVASATPNSEEAVKKEEPQFKVPATKQEVVERVKEIAQDAENASKQELDMLKQAFYKFHKAESVAAQQAYIDGGGDPEKYVPQPDPDEEVYKAEMGVIKEKRAAQFLAQEEQKVENLKAKQGIIDRIKELVHQSPEEVNKSFDEFRELQAKWKEIKAVPAESANELWKNYQLYVEQFYDMLKLNSQLREYDFKKNLEAKTHLCEEAEKLAEETDIIAAFRRLQELHQEFREIGPVSKELREDIWTRFKAASTIINKKHQEHFEALKEKEEENLKKKTELCEKLEAIDLTQLKNYSDWDEKTKEIIEMQAEWKTIGFAPQKMNVKIFERFRGTCDTFFQQKAAFFKTLKDAQNDNLIKKQALANEAEGLKDSTDWKETSNKLIDLQKQWKAIGAVPRKYSEALWKRFIGACDTFFEAKSKAFASQRNEETKNLEAKRAIIEKLETIAANVKNESAQTVRDLIDEWNSVGYVPFREKDKLYKKYHALVDELFKDLHINYAGKRLANFKNSIKDRADRAGGNLNRERERMMRAYEAMKGEIKTYENNIGFLSSSSKSGNSLVNEMKKKAEKLKDDLDLLKKKIEAIDDAIINGVPEPKKEEPKAEKPAEKPAEEKVEAPAETPAEAPVEAPAEEAAPAPAEPAAPEEKEAKAADEAKEEKAE